MSGVSDERRRELGAFLRARRERVAPADVGLPGSGRRRTPGLRREELAAIAGISTTWYTFLEQGRDVRPSRQVLTAIADALRLKEPERAHLLTLQPTTAARSRTSSSSRPRSPTSRTWWTPTRRT